MPIVLYKVDGSPPARAVMMVLDIIGLKVETVEISPFGQNREPEFMAKNPLHTIPFIEDGKFSLADSHAINVYLVSKYGADKKSLLYPSDFEVRATIDQRMYLEAYKFFPKMRECIVTLLIDRQAPPTERQLEDAHEMYGFLEKYLENSKFMAADHVTLADIAFVATLSSMNLLVPFDKFPKLTEWYETMQQFDWYQRANAPGLEKFKKVLEDGWSKVESVGRK